MEEACKACGAVWSRARCDGGVSLLLQSVVFLNTADYNRPGV